MSEAKITLIDSSHKVITIFRGEKGDPGVGGSAVVEVDNHNNSTNSHEDLRIAIGNKASPYFHNQTTLSTSWVINHNLNRPVSVTTFDINGSQITGTVVTNSLDVSSVVFAIAVNGSAYII